MGSILKSLHTTRLEKSWGLSSERILDMTSVEELGGGNGLLQLFISGHWSNTSHGNHTMVTQSQHLGEAEGEKHSWLFSIAVSSRYLQPSHLFLEPWLIMLLKGFIEVPFKTSTWPAAAGPSNKGYHSITLFCGPRSFTSIFLSSSHTPLLSW